MNSLSSSERKGCGYRGLLNFAAQPHWTVFISDFLLRATDVKRIREQLQDCPTRLFFTSLVNDRDPLRQLVAAGFNTRKDYASIQGFITQHRNVRVVEDLYSSLPRRDLATLELPMADSGFDVRFLSDLLRTVFEADYAEQDWISNRFFDLLAAQRPYEVSIATRNALLTIHDDIAWFDIAGRLRDDETRIIPGGEVAYTGDRVSGEFVMDGAILPLEEHPDVAKDARALLALSRNVERHPITFRIDEGRVRGVDGSTDAVSLFSSLFEKDDRYRKVTEVGISFNRACDTFIHDWPAASNEARPGVHLALGGDPVEIDEGQKPLVHVDCMAATTDVHVNSRPFLRSSL